MTDRTDDLDARAARAQGWELRKDINPFTNYWYKGGMFAYAEGDYRPSRDPAQALAFAQEVCNRRNGWRLVLTYTQTGWICLIDKIGDSTNIQLSEEIVDLLMCPEKAAEAICLAILAAVEGERIRLDGTYKCPECGFMEKHLASCSRRPVEGAR